FYSNAIAVELIVPTLPNVRRTYGTWTVDIHHISERFGIFTIIVLGEAFVKVLDDAQGTMIGIDELLFSTVGLLVLYSLWWLYFSDTAGKLVDFASNGKAVIWIYSHMPLATSLVVFGVAAKKAFAEAANYPGEALDPKYRILYTTAIVMYLVALALIDFGLNDEETAKPQIQEALAHIVGAILVAIIGITLVGLSSIAFVTCIAVIMLGQVAFSIYQTNKHEHDGMTHMHTATTQD
ncbi:MAG: low temperature requirement protein A, partial [Chloroflexota bacterium]